MRKASPVAQKCPCVHAIAITPLGDIFRFNQFSKYICCLHPEQRDSTPRVMIFSKLLMRSLSLRPGYSLTILLTALSIDFNSSVSFPIAIQATEFWFLLWWVNFPLNISYLIWTYPFTNPDSRLTCLYSQTPTHDSQLTMHVFIFTNPDSRLTTHVLPHCFYITSLLFFVSSVP